MTKIIKWDGETTNLARFGIVKKGDILTLSLAEWKYVEKNRDKRFKPATKEEIEAPNPNLIVIDREKMGPDAIEEAEKFNREESKRIEGLTKSGSESAAIKTQLEGQTKLELITMAEEINRKERSQIFRIDQNTTRSELLHGLIRHLANEAMDDSELQDEGKES